MAVALTLTAGLALTFELTRFCQFINLLLEQCAKHSVQYFGNLPTIILQVGGTDYNPENVFNNFCCQGFIISNSKIVTLFETIESALKLSRNKFNHRKYLFLPSTEEGETALNIFNSESIRFIADIVVITSGAGFASENAKNMRDADQLFEFYTHKYVGHNTNEAFLLDRWFTKNESYQYGNNLYPNKLENQLGRVLKIATFTYKPYSIAGQLDGTEILIILEYARRHNTTPQFIIDEEAEWGAIYNDWTGNGTLGNTATDRSDIGIGALGHWEHDYDYLDYSQPIIRTGITCLVPAPQLRDGWLTPFVSFSTELWIVVGISFILCCMAIYTVRSHAMWKINGREPVQEIIIKSIVMTEAMFVLQPLTRIPKNTFLRTTYILIFILCITMATIYGSGLSSNMTIHRYQGAILTIEDLVNSQLLWGATSNVWINSIIGDPTENYKILAKRYVSANSTYLQNMNRQQFAYGIERLQGGNFAIGTYIDLEGVNSRDLMNEDIYWDFTVTMSRKNSILMPSIDKWMLRIAQTGIINIWEYQAVSRNLNIKVQTIVRSYNINQKREPSIITLKHVYGVFSIWLIGVVVAMISFSLELLLFYLASK